MINGAHVIIHTKDPESDRAFFRDILKLPSVDAGQSSPCRPLKPRFIPAKGTTRMNCTSCVTT